MENPHVTKNIITTSIEKGEVRVETTPVKHDPTDNTLPTIVEAFCGIDFFNDLPILDISNRTGHTGYIDFIRPKDMSAPVMRGTDDHGRPFVSFRLDFDGEAYVETIFRRYTTGSVWTSGGGTALASGMLTDDDLKIIERLLNGEEIDERTFVMPGEEKKKIKLS